MSFTLDEFQKITTAEEYLDFFQIPYEQQVVNVNRLHILKKFSQAIAAIDNDYPNLTEEEKLQQYRAALLQAYEVFLTKTPLETKLFKVFHQKPQNIVMLSDIQA